jgi:hypothetical protein
MAIDQISQILTGITFAKATVQNIDVANTPTGGTANSLTDIITPVTLATGKITATSGNVAISGTNTNFLRDFSVGEYLFYYDNISNEPVLLGQIATVSTITAMTLTSGSPVTISAPGANCGKTKVIISNRDDILIRVPVIRLDGSGTQFALPNWAQWLINPPGKYGDINDSNTNNLKRYSDVNFPSVQATPPIQNLSYSIRAIFNWPSVTVGNDRLYFPSSANIPNFAYALLDRSGISGSEFAPNTLYKLMAKEFFNLNCIRAGLNYSRENLIAAGYIPE